MRYMVVTCDCGWDIYIDIYDNLLEAINNSVKNSDSYTNITIYELGNEVMSDSQIKFLAKEMEKKK